MNRLIVSSDKIRIEGMLVHAKERPLGWIPFKYRAAWVKRIKLLESLIKGKLK